MIDFLISLPLWALAVVLNVWLIGFALTSLWALRRWILPRLRIDTDASLFLGAAVMQSAMVLYGLVAALTAVSVWTRHSQVADTVSSEATAISILWRDLGGYPEHERDSMRNVLRGYTKQVIEEAWPMTIVASAFHGAKNELQACFAQPGLLRFSCTSPGRSPSQYIVDKCPTG